MATTRIFVILCDWVRHYPEDMDFYRTQSKQYLSQTEMETFGTPWVISILKTVAVIRLVNFFTVTYYYYVCTVRIK